MHLPDDALSLISARAGLAVPAVRLVSKAWKRDVDAALRREAEERVVALLAHMRIQTQRGRVPMRYVLATHFGDGRRAHDVAHPKYVCGVCREPVRDVATCVACRRPRTTC